MDWFDILAPVFEKLFENCTQSRRKRAKRIKRNGPLVRVRLTRSLRRDGLDRDEARAKVAAIQEDIAAASVPEIEEFLEGLEVAAATAGVEE